MSPEEVPRILWSDYTGRPFETCLVCRAWLEAAEVHVVEKVIRRGETILEMALCGECCARLSQDVSEESLKVIQEVQTRWLEEADPEGRTCPGCRRDREETDGFVIAGYFIPGHLLVRAVTVCEDCHAALEEKLSRKTRESFRGFVDTHFPGVPEDVESPVFFS